jgi:hypothetical protein
MQATPGRIPSVFLITDGNWAGVGVTTDIQVGVGSACNVAYERVLQDVLRPMAPRQLSPRTR